jgi:hypothetical protein
VGDHAGDLRKFGYLIICPSTPLSLRDRIRASQGLDVTVMEVVELGRVLVIPISKCLELLLHTGVPMILDRIVSSPDKVLCHFGPPIT